MIWMLWSPICTPCAARASTTRSESSARPAGSDSASLRSFTPAGTESVALGVVVSDLNSPSTAQVDLISDILHVAWRQAGQQGGCNSPKLFVVGQSGTGEHSLDITDVGARGCLVRLQYRYR